LRVTFEQLLDIVPVDHREYRIFIPNFNGGERAVGMAWLEAEGVTVGRSVWIRAFDVADPFRLAVLVDGDARVEE